MHQRGGHYLAVAIALLDRDHSLGSAPVAGVLGDSGTLAIPIFGGGQHRLLLVFCHQHRDDALAFLEHHSPHTTCGAAHRPDIIFVKANRLATIGKQHHIVLPVGQRSADQEVARVQVDRDDAGLARVAEFVERGLLDRPHPGCHEYILVRRKAALGASQRQHHRDLFAVLQRKHVDDRSSARAA